jgi:hypothetical protein
LNVLFADVEEPALSELRRRIYDFHRWRLNLREAEIRRRFDEVTDAMLSIIDLFGPNDLTQPTKSELQSRISAVIFDLSSLDEEIAGGARAG